MSKYWNTNTKNIEPYVPGEQPKDKTYIKLNTNENPYPPSPRVLEAIQNAVNENLRLYPDSSAEELRQRIAQYYNLTKDQVFVGNGSDEILAFSFAAFFEPGQIILFPDITYSFYPVYADLFQLDYQIIPLDTEFTIPTEEFFTENGGIIIPNPNAPTGKYLPISQLEQIIDFNYRYIQKVTLIDEAYVDFGGQSVIPLINRYPNLLVIHTLSKSRSLAGLRVGYALGHHDLIEGLYRVKSSINSYTLDRLALVGACAAFQDEEYFQATRQKIMKTREWVTQELIMMDFQVTDSQANFIFISHSQIHASQLYKELKEKGVLVRYFNKPRIDNFLRVSIGSDEDMKAFLAILKPLLTS
jgi:histidinol-phosphate aminotransferase